MHDTNALVAQGLARWHNGRLIPIIMGGDGRDEPLFALPPGRQDDGSYDFTEIEEDGDLAALGAALRERVQEVLAGRADPDVVGDRTRTQVAEEMQQAVLAIEAIDAELAARTEDETTYDSTLESLASRAGVQQHSEEGPEDEGDETEGDGDENGEGEATTAAATAEAETGTSRQPRPLPAARRHRPTAAEQDDGLGLRVTPHAAGLGSPMQSMTLLDRSLMGEFLDDIIHKNRVTPGAKVVLAHARFEFPKERLLSEGPDGYLVNAAKVQAVTGNQALVASGENCAPLPPRYELPGVETAARPVRAALESFQATRGGVQVGVTPTMGDYEDAVGVVTAEENAEGGTFAVKNCMRIVCPDFNPVSVDSIYQCIEADNLAARSYPELMSRIGDLVMAEQARLADSKLLSAIKAGSTNVTGGTAAAGAVFAIFGDVFKLGAGIRSRNRMTPDAPLTGLFPAWIIDLLQLDTVRAVNQDNRDATRAGVEALLRRAGIIPYFYLDGPSTGDGQVFSAQSAGAINSFPSHIQWALYPAGSWLHLDAGELNLGVVRDSSLNATNDFQIFAETWENVAFTGVESDWVTTTICPSGTYAGGVDMHATC